MLAASGGFTEDLTDESSTREAEVSYDELDRPVLLARSSTEATWDQQNPATVWRNTVYEPDWTTGMSDLFGPDGITNTTVADAAGRITTLLRDDTQITFTHDEANRLTGIEYASGATVTREYNEANRLTAIEHKDAGSTTILRLAYSWTADGLVESITDTDPVLGNATVSFTYDTRNRLIAEVRTGPNAYDLAYTYDNGGNRTAKFNNITDETTVYHYDVDDPEAYGSQNNRLMGYEVLDSESETVETAWYAYHVSGNPDQIVRKRADDEHFYRTYFLFDRQGRVWIAVKDKWTEGSEGPENCERTWAREFRYAGTGRSRYLTRPRDPSTLLPVSANDGLWSDYESDTIYADHTIASGGTVTNKTRYVPGLWQKDLTTSDEACSHGDMIGTTRALTDDNGDVSRRAIFTACGEQVMEDGSFATRYGYAGAWGYEGDGLCAGEPGQLWADNNKLGFLHVGERLYDPVTGRFLQRDPIGLRGGLNTYLYVSANPVLLVDPRGLSAPTMEWNWSHFSGATAAGATSGAARGALTGTPLGPAGVGGGALGGGISGAVGGAVAYCTAWAVGCINDIVEQNRATAEQEARNLDIQRRHPEIWPPQTKPDPGPCPYSGLGAGTPWADRTNRGPY